MGTFALFRKFSPRFTRCYVRYQHVDSSKLFLTEFGDPAKVVKKEEFALQLADMASKQVLVKMLQAPINPADINTIQGVYGVKPNLPFTLGNEGFGIIEKAGSEVKNLKVGDWVIPGTNAWGTWRSYALEEEKNLIKIPNDLDPAMAATLAVNPCTAFRMLQDFETLSKGDTVLQNAANSAVGQNVIQIARHLGFRTVNILRNREGIEKLKQDLQDLGADYVLTEEEFRASKLFKNGELAQPKLVLNCVSGKAVIELVKAMAENGTLVTYGGMSRQPLIVPTSAFIFKNIRLVGYWMTRWNWQHGSNSTERKDMLAMLCNMAKQGSLVAPKHEFVPLDSFQEALARSCDTTRFHETKLIFKF